MIDSVLHPLDRKLQYCSSVSCCFIVVGGPSIDMQGSDPVNQIAESPRSGCTVIDCHNKVISAYRPPGRDCDVLLLWEWGAVPVIKY